MSPTPKTPPILGLKSLCIALVLEAGLFVGLAQVLGPHETTSSLPRNLTWVPEDHAENLVEEQKEPDLPEPEERTPSHAPLSPPRISFREELLPPLPSENPTPKPRPKLLPFSPDPLNSPSLTRNLSKQRVPKKYPSTETPSPTPRPASLPIPSEAQAKTLSPVEGWNPKPPYPKRAIRLGQEGSVQLELQVDAKGRVRNIQVLKGSGSPLLDLVSRKTLATWRYDGGPGKVHEQIVFRLVGGEAGVEVGRSQDGRFSPNPRSRK